MLQAVKNSTCDFLNFYKYPADMPVAGKYEIPVVKGIRIKHPEKLKVIAFDECHLIPQKERKQYIVHFYIYDYKFERVWSYINKNTEYLKQFKGCIAPDFSQYVDMPRAMQIWNLWRCNFMAYWWQSHGIPVIYNACWSDKKSLKYTFDGAPRNSCICVSSKGCILEDRRHTKTDTLVATDSRFRAGFLAAVNKLTPTQVVWLGTKPEWLESVSEEYGFEVITPLHRKLYQERLDKIPPK